MRHLLFLFLTLTATSLSAQLDPYHTQLNDWLAVQYTLTDATFPFYDTEVEVMQNRVAYGAGTTNGTVSDQDFTRIQTIRVPGGQVNRWDSGWNVRNTVPVANGDKLLWVVYLRVAPTQDGNSTGRVALFAERNDNFDKEFDVIVDLNETWTRYFIPFEIGTRTHPVGGLTVGLQLGFQQQNVQVGGLAIFNYGPDVPLDQLPNDLGSDQYGGFEADAPWRAEAADRIEQLRKADLDLTVIGSNGNPLMNADVRVEMQQHDFEWGTAIAGTRLPGGRNFNRTFTEKLLDLDGEGHGFNAIVYENDLKWPGYEQEWVTTNEQLARAINYFDERGIHQRGHVLLWPGWQNMPDRMFDNRNDPAYLRRTVRNHVTRMLETLDLDQMVPDWDVLNEINTNVDLAAALRGTPGYPTGREIYAEVFKLADSLAPDAELYINDYITMSLKNTAGSVIYDQYKGFIREMVDQGAPIDGIGFQGHLSASPNSIYEVLETLDDFYAEFGLDSKITEYDLPRSVPQELAANYTRDFMTAVFSHPSSTGLMSWNWWDTDTWANPGANLYTADWQEKSVHQVYVDQLFNEWWTEEDLTTNASGAASVRGFKGRYLVTVGCDNGDFEVELNLNEDKTVTYDCATMTTAVRPEFPAGSITVSPNPSHGPVRIQNGLPTKLSGELYDVRGRTVWVGTVHAGTTELSLDLPAGTYQLRVTDGRSASTLRLVRQ